MLIYLIHSLPDTSTPLNSKDLLLRFVHRSLAIRQVLRLVLHRLESLIIALDLAPIRLDLFGQLAKG
jgi:hypothetical protein